MKLEVKPLTPERWDDFVAVMGSNGAYAGCWCMWWRVWPRKKFGTTAGERGPKMRRAMRKVVASGEPPGVLAYVDGEPAAWCSIAPRASYEALRRSPAYRPIDEREAWSVVCFYAAKPYRGAGLMPKLLRAACDYASERGARLVEGYPAEPDGKASPVDLYMGTAATFRKAGFKEVGRTTNGKPIMRKALRARRTR